MNQRRLIAATLVAAVALLVTACSPVSNGGDTAADTTLTAAISSPPVSLDPSKAQAGPGLWYTQAAYASLLNLSPDGKLTPGLAEKWGYVDDANKEFEFTLRDGLVFADGTPLTSKEVIASIDYFKQGTGPSAAAYRGFTLTAVDDLTVHISSEQPNPVIDQLLMLDNLGGMIISPAGLADPEALSGATFGAGPYVLDNKESVPGDHYVYTPNKNYYDQDAIHYESITIVVIPNNTSAAQALKSGQIDVMVGDSTVVDLIDGAANLTYITKPTLWTGMYLLDRDGTITPALADVKVRQALNYAIDRDAIAKATYGDFGRAQVQPAVPGFDGYDKSLESNYGYDVEKAKKLLAEAGYADGFTIPVQYQSFDPASTKMIQAVAAQLAEVGVTLELKGATNFGEYVTDLMSKKFAISVLNATGGIPAYLDGQFAYLPGAVLNPFGVSDPDIIAAYTDVAAATSDTAAEAGHAFTKVLVDKAITVPVAQVDIILMFDKKLGGFEFQEGSTMPTPITSWFSK